MKATLIRTALAFGMLALVPTIAWSQEAQTSFEEANQLLTRGDAQGARARYEALRETGVHDSVLEHNLGNAYVRTDALGRAIAAYRRGLRLAPSEKVAEALSRNLEIVRRLLQERYRSGDEGRQFIYVDPGRVLYRLAHLLPMSSLTWLTIGLWWLLLVLLILRRRKPSWSWVGPSAIPVAIIVVLSVLMLWGQIRFDATTQFAVVVNPKASLQDGPHSDARGVPLAEGMELLIVESQGAWTQVQIAGGRRGWVPNTALVKL